MWDLLWQCYASEENLNPDNYPGQFVRDAICHMHTSAVYMKLS